jgi:hypothetical protein
MQAVHVAVLIWRFVGLAFIAKAIPGTVMLTAGVARGITSGMNGVADATFFTTLTVVVQIIIGVTIIRFSKQLGELIAQGL